METNSLPLEGFFPVLWDELRSGNFKKKFLEYSESKESDFIKIKNLMEYYLSIVSHKEIKEKDPYYNNKASADLFYSYQGYGTGTIIKERESFVKLFNYFFVDDPKLAAEIIETVDMFQPFFFQVYINKVENELDELKKYQQDLNVSLVKNKNAFNFETQREVKSSPYAKTLSPVFSKWGETNCVEYIDWFKCQENKIKVSNCIHTSEDKDANYIFSTFKNSCDIQPSLKQVNSSLEHTNNCIHFNPTEFGTIPVTTLMSKFSTFSLDKFKLKTNDYKKNFIDEIVQASLLETLFPADFTKSNKHLINFTSNLLNSLIKDELCELPLEVQMKVLIDLQKLISSYVMVFRSFCLTKNQPHRFLLELMCGTISLDKDSPQKLQFEKLINSNSFSKEGLIDKEIAKSFVNKFINRAFKFSGKSSTNDLMNGRNERDLFKSMYGSYVENKFSSGELMSLKKSEHRLRDDVGGDSHIRNLFNSWTKVIFSFPNSINNKIYNRPKFLFSLGGKDINDLLSCFSEGVTNGDIKDVLSSDFVVNIFGMDFSTRPKIKFNNLKPSNGIKSTQYYQSFFQH